MTSGWDTASIGREHVFTSGRTALLRKQVNLFTIARNSALGPALLGHLDQAAEGELKDPNVALEVVEAIVVTMWIAPEVMAPGDERDPVPGERVRFDDLFTEEVNETVELWQASLEDAARFRDGAAGNGDGGGGAGLAGTAKPASRPRARKRAGVGG